MQQQAHLPRDRYSRQLHIPQPTLLLKIRPHCPLPYNLLVQTVLCHSLYSAIPLPVGYSDLGGMKIYVLNARFMFLVRFHISSIEIGCFGRPVHWLENTIWWWFDMPSLTMSICANSALMPSIWIGHGNDGTPILVVLHYTLSESIKGSSNQHVVGCFFENMDLEVHSYVPYLNRYIPGHSACRVQLSISTHH